MVQEIQNKLIGIEEKYNVRILYACESGSRAWGFPSTGSDYDVRFIYSLSKEQYLSIKDKKDTIDIPVNEALDINGWDFRKSLRLFYNSNAPLYEWLQSPIIYKQDDSFLIALKALMPEYFSLRKGMHHYLSMAKNAWTELHGDEVRIKKYFYCLHPLLAARWIVDKQELPPMEFALLRTQIKDESRQKAIDELLTIKTQATEKTTIQPIPVLSTFIEEQMEFCKQQVSSTNKENVDIEPLNILFRNFIS
ncbi:MAG: nucleotidyltransferase domain-containing protein [Bacteroidales bacterium]|jgi:predicted nucleotidyltransferase|nr:nucleotidyltransferase domain-containing protein [Bacteroidales bacterium]